MAAETHFIQTIIGVGILLFAAKLMAELFLRLNLPIVLGELLAGMIIGPFALGSFLVFDGEHLLKIDSELRVLGEIGAIVILFMAGLEMTPKEFLRGGKSSFTVGTLGVVIPFFAGLWTFQAFGFDALQSMLIATALTATSIADIDTGPQRVRQDKDPRGTPESSAPPWSTTYLRSPSSRSSRRSPARRAVQRTSI